MITKDYYEYYNKYSKDYSNVIILIQIGSFYEIYSYNNDIIDIFKISELLNINCTRKNKKSYVSMTNPYMCGFPCPSLNKYLPVLIEGLYTVIIIDQYINKDLKKEVQRKVKGIYSKGTNIDYSGVLNNNTMSIYIEEFNNKTYNIGACCIDVSTGENTIYETYSEMDNIKEDKLLALDNIYSYIKKNNPTEIIIELKNCHEKHDIEYYKKYFELNKQIIHVINKEQYNHKDKTNIHFQQTVLKNLFLNENNNMTLLNIFEYLDLDKLTNAITAYINLILFLEEHNVNCIKKINKPKIYNHINKYLKLTNNSIEQLNIIDENKKNKSVFDIIDKTQTAIGKRLLLNRLLNPLIDESSINKRLSRIEDYINKINEKDKILITKNLKNINDIVKILRKIKLKTILPNELFKLITTIKNLLSINNILLKGKSNYTIKEVDKVNNLICYFSKIFNSNLELCNNLDDTNYNNIFNNDYDIELTNLRNTYKTTKEEIYKVVKDYNNLIKNDDIEYIKLYIENEDIYLTTTKIRYNLFYSKLNTSQKQDITESIQKNSVKIYSKLLNKYNNTLTKINNEIIIIIKKHWEYELNYLNNESNLKLIHNLIKYIGNIDISNSMYLLNKTALYTKPEVINDVNSDTSYVIADSLRHPLIEQINQNEIYIPNDINIGVDNINGIILYSLNAAGKSSLLKAVGINIILAQAGLYTATKKLKINIFENIITRINGGDNINKGQSSFVVEMLDLKNIINRSDEKTLVLGDEICHGTEHISANAIVIATIKELSKKRVNFLFATHLHAIKEYISDLKNVIINHLSITITESKIIFDRKLKDGPGPSVYGIEVAEHLNFNKEFINECYKIRNVITKEHSIIPIKKSNYNKNLFLDKCSICNYKPYNDNDLPLDTHHINKQCFANSNNIIEHYNKNILPNLMILCKSCHIEIHK